ncbi:hypothetical protein VPHD479_0211 [Vibrio phage D479]
MQLAFTTKSEFEDLMSREDVTVKSSWAGPEYITAIYKDDQIIGERVLHIAQADHYILRPEPKQVIKPKTSRLP